MSAFLYNDEWVEDAIRVNPLDPGFRWGVGLIETMLWKDDRINLLPFHLDRLRTGMLFLQLTPQIDAEWLQSRSALLLKQFPLSTGKLRLQVFMKSGGGWGFLLELTTFDSQTTNPLSIGIYPHARKSMDAIAQLKTSNHLLYHLAGQWATEEGLQEAVVLNPNQHLADGSRSNVFLIKNGVFSTPAPDQGGVSGVMRRAVIQGIKGLGLEMKQEAVSVQDLLHADEVFLTNALRGIQPVSSFRDKSYTTTQASELWNSISSTFC